MLCDEFVRPYFMRIIIVHDIERIEKILCVVLCCIVLCLLNNWLKFGRRAWKWFAYRPFEMSARLLHVTLGYTTSFANSIRAEYFKHKTNLDWPALCIQKLELCVSISKCSFASLANSRNVDFQLLAFMENVSFYLQHFQPYIVWDHFEISFVELS